MWRPYHDGGPNDLTSRKAYPGRQSHPPTDIDIEIQGAADIQDKSQATMNPPASATGRVTGQSMPEAGAPGTWAYKPL